MNKKCIIFPDTAAFLPVMLNFTIKEQITMNGNREGIITCPHRLRASRTPFEHSAGYATRHTAKINIPAMPSRTGNFLTFNIITDKYLCGAGHKY